MKYKAALIDELRARTAVLFSSLRRSSVFEQSDAEIPTLTDLVTQRATGAAVLVSEADISAQRMAEGRSFSETQVRILMNDVLDSVLHDPGADSAFALDESLRLHLVQAAQDAFANVFFDLRQQMLNRVAEAVQRSVGDAVI